MYHTYKLSTSCFSVLKLSPTINIEIQVTVRNVENEYLFEERLSHGRYWEVGITTVVFDTCIYDYW